MSFYPSDGEMYAGWSTGRWFGLIGLIGLTFSLLGRQMIHGWLGPSLPLSDQMIAVFLEYVGAGMFCLMTLCALASIGISRAERGDVEITAEGVTRIFAPGKVKFVPRAQIAGLVPRPGGGMSLLDERGQTIVVVPRSIMDYRACIAELKEMGIPTQPPKQAAPALAWKPENWKERIQLWGFYCCGPMLFCRGSLADHLPGVVITASWLAWIALDYRKDPIRRRRWISLAWGIAAYGVGWAALHRIWPSLRH